MLRRGQPRVCPAHHARSRTLRPGKIARRRTRPVLGWIGDTGRCPIWKNFDARSNNSPTSWPGLTVRVITDKLPDLGKTRVELIPWDAAPRRGSLNICAWIGPAAPRRLDPRQMRLAAPAIPPAGIPASLRPSAPRRNSSTLAPLTGIFRRGLVTNAFSGCERPILYRGGGRRGRESFVNNSVRRLGRPIARLLVRFP